LNKALSHPIHWEYKLVSMGNPLEPDTGLRANAVGKLGWELAAIDAGVWIFKRPVLEESASPLQAIMEETVPMTEPEPVTAVSAISYRASHQAQGVFSDSASGEPITPPPLTHRVARRVRPYEVGGSRGEAGTGRKESSGFV
jgi:hypothetical protein